MKSQRKLLIDEQTDGSILVFENNDDFWSVVKVLAEAKMNIAIRRDEYAQQLKRVLAAVPLPPRNPRRFVLVPAHLYSGSENLLYTPPRLDSAIRMGLQVANAINTSIPVVITEDQLEEQMQSDLQDISSAYTDTRHADGSVTAGNIPVCNEQAAVANGDA